MSRFRYSGLRFDRVSGVAEFDFALEHSGQRWCFTEAVEFPLPKGGAAEVDLAAFYRVLELLYIAVGTFYYKVRAARHVSVDAVALAPAAADWTRRLYRDGLAEFAHRNAMEHVLDLPVHSRDRLPAAGLHDLGDSCRAPLVGFSGGKDSIVALEVLKSAGFAPATFTTARRIKPQLGQLVDRAQVELLQVRPRPDPQLKQLLKQQVLLPGHAPLTAMTSLVGTAVAALHGLGPAVMANERSADEPNLLWRGREVNHQWAKSSAAEEALDRALGEHAGIASGCFSLVRGMGELEISRWFAATDGYDDLFSSCNVVVRSKDPDRTQRWCQDCAKCRWVFLALASVMTRSRLVGIFGRDLLEDQAQTAGYRELLGLVGHKPLECVGEVVEARVAFRQLAEGPQWRDAAVVRELAGQVPAVAAADTARAWRVDRVRSVPAAYQAALDGWSSSAAVSQGGS
ncbi:hypothetical protein [Pseudonocardia sp. KRD291]|uniref:hypothetical protein n=1 Tax=Pseudonocardia sp. KRD291 TaxID=2792007 RepID=UPI001C49CA69|nr:hypothetical protein [Pseudonocardia sp. KRD291]MBW0102930.1 hypothetical protein [Pseudonocardia sp. KRD291]